VIRVVLPVPLATLAHVSREIEVELDGTATLSSLIDAVEARYPVLRGTIRDFESGARRPFLRYYALECDLSHEPPETPLPAAVAEGKEPFIVLGSISGG
jgi:sulfur-carrier protein